MEEKGLWTLADDLEHVLAHRDARDLDVFEAASWALAANRVKAERRRQLWQEPLPAVELADRLRRITLFDFVEVRQLFWLAQVGRQFRYEPGHVIYRRGGAVGTVQFLLDGKVTIQAQDGEHGMPAPAALGLEEVLEGSPMQATVVAAERSILLSLTSDEFLALLSENGELAEGIFRTMIQSRDLVAATRCFAARCRPTSSSPPGTMCSRSIASCCCNRARCSRTRRRRSYGGCRPSRSQ